MKHTSTTKYLLSEKKQYMAYRRLMLSEGWKIKKPQSHRKGDLITVKFEREIK